MSNGKDIDHDLDSWHPLEFGETEYTEEQLVAEWLKAKEAERVAVNIRRLAEDRLLSALAITEAEGTNSYNRSRYQIKVTQRFNRTIDADLLQEIAAEHGITQHLGTLFRWKPDINAKAWKDADATITGPLEQAITTKPGRPSFSIERVAQKDK